MQVYPELEIVVVVNPSGDGTEEAIRENFPQIKVIHTHKNLGFFPALNIAIANANGDYIMMVDDDAYFLDNDAITNLVAEFQKEPKLGAVTCNLEGPNETSVDADRYIESFTTGFTVMPKKVYTEWVGYYPDLFFRSAGETYICTRLWELGHPVKRLANIRMYHERAIQGRSERDWKFHGLRSQVLCVIIRDPWYLIFPHLLSIGVKSFFQFLRVKNLRTWICAWISALYHIPKAMVLRNPISWRTQRLLWRLRHKTISNIHSLDSWTSSILEGRS